jgi:hypothetical protein
LHELNPVLSLQLLSPKAHVVSPLSPQKSMFRIFCLFVNVRTENAYGEQEKVELTVV